MVTIQRAGEETRVATLPEAITLTEEQSKLFPGYMAVRKAVAESTKLLREKTKEIDLPKFKGQTGKVKILDCDGNLVGIVDIGFKKGFEFPACWPNEITEV